MGDFALTKLEIKNKFIVIANKRHWTAMMKKEWDKNDVDFFCLTGYTKPEINRGL